MPGPEEFLKASEHTREHEASLGEKVRRDIDEHPVFDVVHTDTEAYRRLAAGVHVLLIQSLEAADVLRAALAASPSPFTESEKMQRQDYITEVMSWTVSYPRVLSALRLTQYDATVHSSIDILATHVHDELRSAELLEKNRRGIVHRSVIPKAILGRMTLEQLTKVLTFDVIKKHRVDATDAVKQDKGMLNAHLQSIGLLRAQEKDAAVRIRETQAATTRARDESTGARAELGSHRVSQGLPGAALILDQPEPTMAVWERLLLEATTTERRRVAQQLRQSVEAFQRDFMDRASLITFEERLEKIVEVAKKENSKERRTNILKHILPFGSDLVDRLTTDDAAFDHWHTQLRDRARAAFQSLQTDTHRTQLARLSTILLAMEKGNTVDAADLKDLLHAYAVLQANNRDTMCSVQRLQLLGDALLPGGRGPQDRGEHLLDQATKVDGVSGVETLRRLAPYGAFQTLGYTDADGRFVLLPPEKGGLFSGRPVLSHLTELPIAALEGAGVAVVLHTIFSSLRIPIRMTAVPLVSSAAASLYTKFAQPVAFAVSMAGIQDSVLQGIARRELVTLHVTSLNASLKDLANLQQGVNAAGRRLSQPEQRAALQRVADEVFASMVSLILAAEQQSRLPFSSSAGSTRPTPSAVLEAHVYTNELLQAFGFPGYHQLPPGFTLPSDAKLSPEAHRYREALAVQTTDASRRQLDQLRAYRDRLAFGQDAAPDATRRSHAEQVIDGTDIPERRVGDALHTLKETSASSVTTPRLEDVLKQKSSVELLATAGSIFFVQSEIAPLRRALIPNPLEKYWQSWFGGPKTLPELVQSKPSYRALLDRARPLAHLSQTEVIAVARTLTKHPPSNQVLRSWYGGAYDVTLIEKYFGPEGKRHDLSSMLLTEWELVRLFVTECDAEAKK